MKIKLIVRFGRIFQREIGRFIKTLILKRQIKSYAGRDSTKTHYTAIGDTLVQYIERHL